MVYNSNHLWYLCLLQWQNNNNLWHYLFIWMTKSNIEVLFLLFSFLIFSALIPSFLHLAVVNLTLIYLPGLTKVVVGMLQCFFFIFHFKFHHCPHFQAYIQLLIKMVILFRGVAWDYCRRHWRNGSYMHWEGKEDVHWKYYFLQQVSVHFI